MSECCRLGLGSDAMALTPLSAGDGDSAAARGFARRPCAPVAGSSSKNPAGLLAVAFAASCCHLKEWTTFVSDSARAEVP